MTSGSNDYSGGYNGGFKPSPPFGGPPPIVISIHNDNFNDNSHKAEFEGDNDWGHGWEDNDWGSGTATDTITHNIPASVSQLTDSPPEGPTAH